MLEWKLQHWTHTDKRIKEQRIKGIVNNYALQTVDKALLLQGFAIVGTAFLI